MFPVLYEYVYKLMMMSFLVHSFISSFSSIMCAMDYMYNTTVGKYHSTCSQCCMSISIFKKLKMLFLAHSFISSFSSIMCAMDYMYNTTGGKYYCTCSHAVLYEYIYIKN